MNERGAALIVLMFVMLALLVLGFVAYQQVGIARFDQREDYTRSQTLWLARSAAATRKSATLSVPIDEGETADVNVRVSRNTVTATVTLSESTATVIATYTDDGKVATWQERYAPK